jgi:hypothetical protein
MDVGGSLAGLKEEMESGKGEERAFVEFWGEIYIENEIGGGVKIRLCNELEATEHL